MNPNIDLKTIIPKVKKSAKKLTKHAVFAAVIFVLLAYLLVVWRISQMANLEPTEDSVTTAEASNNIPKVDKNAVKQIQSLENSSTELHSLFNQARNNPFQE